MEILIGGDPHKATNSAAAIGGASELLEQATFAASRQGLRALGTWAKRFPRRRWAVEGASGLRRAVAQFLVANGEDVVDVPAKLSVWVRLLFTGGE